MKLTIEQLLKSKGLKKVNHLEDILESKSFLVNSFLNERDHFIVYPIIHKKANLCHDLLNLYGVHWSYKVLKDNWKSIKKLDGDTNKILSKNSKPRNKIGAVYAFTQRMVNNADIYWIFKEKTEGWDYYQNILLPLFSRDMHLYKDKKSLFKKTYK
ncbi:MAG: hypothetical protein PHV16_04320 [Candidatus Nanoarchaeia archaeon]|nr:hypothetical protein [Candidatus Nanoarchaeia archaeon]